MIFELNQAPPNKWIAILSRGNYAHKSTLCVYPKKAIVERDLLILEMTNFADSEITAAVNMVPEWVSATNEKYNEMQRKIARTKQQKKEEERKKKLKAIEQENRINSLLADL